MTKGLVRLARRLTANRRGGTAIEYGLIAALIAVAAIAAMKGLANVTTGMWNTFSSQVVAAR
jgi:pilus assembly protein Flp/PilA